MSPASPAVGLSLPIRAVGQYSDGTTQDLSAAAVWSSSAPAVATVDGGLVLGLALGTTTITAETGGFSASFELPVMPPVVTAIEIGPYGTPGTFGAARPADHVATLRLVDDRFRNWPVLDGGTVTSSNPSVLARHAGDGARSLDRRHGHRQ